MNKTPSSRNRYVRDQKITRVREEERRRISREIHDHLGQLTTGLALGLKALELDVGPSVVPAVKNLLQLATELNNEIHDLCRGLRFVALEKLGLANAVSEHLATWSIRSKIQYSFELDNPANTSVPSDLELILYRILVEATTNIRKHASATRALVRLTVRSDKVRIEIEDNGIGFSHDPKSSSDRFGLVGLREQVGEVDGVFCVESEPRVGTLLRAEIPLLSGSPDDIPGETSG
jgi:signal transduction histidine kinase